MKHTARTIQVTFKNEIKPFLLKSDEWEIVTIGRTNLTARLIGDIDKIIKLLSRFDIKDISLPNASLQDVFLDYYKEEGDQ